MPSDELMDEILCGYEKASINLTGNVCPKCKEKSLCFGHMKCHSCNWAFTRESLQEERDKEI